MSIHPPAVALVVSNRTVIENGTSPTFNLSGNGLLPKSVLTISVEALFRAVNFPDCAIDPVLSSDNTISIPLFSRVTSDVDATSM